jgi:hypothetical protein
MSEEQLVFNGINIHTGDYIIPPMTLKEFSGLVEQETPIDRYRLAILRARNSLGENRLGAQDSVDDIQKLAEAGWGIIFPAGMNADHLKALKAALHPLLALRKQQAGAYYNEFCGEKGYRSNDTPGSWLPRHGMSPVEQADPSKVPYYLLLVGSPEEIPFTFQCDLDVIYAVGRLYFEQGEGETFEDTLAHYASYAQSVANAENREGFLHHKAAFFGVANYYDEHTSRSSRLLVAPLATELQQKYQNWETIQYLKEQATKDTLSQLINGANPPALLFTASHGVETDLTTFQAQCLQGALLCQDWPGPVWGLKRQGLKESFYFSAHDVSDNAALLGMITFHFACYGAGTTRFKQLHYTTPTHQRQMTKDFISYLPQRLLSHPKGGALAVIGNINQVLGYSFTWPGIGKQISAMRDTLGRLMAGKRVGWAVECLNQRHATSSAVWSSKQTEIEHHLILNEKAQKELAELWTAYTDARNYFLLGDPAVKLPLVNVNV